MRVGPSGRLSRKELHCGAGEDSWESLGQQGHQTSQSWRRSTLNIHWKDWCWSLISNTLDTWCEELTLEKTLMLGKIEAGSGADRGWDGWIAHECGQTPGDNEGRGSLAGCYSWVAESQTRLSDWTAAEAGTAAPPASVLVVSTRATLHTAPFSLTTSLAILVFLQRR